MSIDDENKDDESDHSNLARQQYDNDDIYDDTNDSDDDDEDFDDGNEDYDDDDNGDDNDDNNDDADLARHQCSHIGGKQGLGAFSLHRVQSHPLLILSSLSSFLLSLSSFSSSL